MDCTIRFWNNEAGVVCSRYFDSNSKNLIEKLLESTKLLDLSKLLQLSLDSPNVNWDVLKLMSPTKEKKSIQISSALEGAVSTFMGHFKVVLTRRIGSWQRYFVQCMIFLKSHLLGLTNRYENF